MCGSSYCIFWRQGRESSRRLARLRLPKLNLFLACFDRGLCRAVSGDTPNSPLVSLVLFKFLLSSGDSPMLPCWTKEHLAKVLNLESSVAAFSRTEIFDWQLSQMKEGNWSSGHLELCCGTPRSLPILPANCCFIPQLLNKETLFRTNIFLA